ncbi:multiprotein-bridging factor 1 family protein [Dactylosporangium cerinum]|uniref:Multiprotein-bridging factor 1 family protein n=1 Tax=Dactylosporangium cerinum TaxID=1434730 RepID=A0ABV9WI50_9ACTN
MSEAGSRDSPLHIAARTPGNQRFGQLLTALRQRAELTPTQLAGQAGVNPSFVRGIERGVQAPSMRTARTLLDCFDQDRIQWPTSGPADLIIREPGTEHTVAFTFTAKVKGQNHRPDAGPVAAAYRLASTMRDLGPEASKQLADPETGALASASRLATTITDMIPQMFAALSTADENITGPSASEQSAAPKPGDDTRFARIVRRLATADNETLARVERVLDVDQYLRDNRQQQQEDTVDMRPNPGLS